MNEEQKFSVEDMDRRIRDMERFDNWLTLVLGCLALGGVFGLLYLLSAAI